MKSILRTAALSMFAIVLATPSPLSASDLVRPGLWENVSTMEAGPGAGRPTRTTHCYTAKELAGLNARDGNSLGNGFATPANSKCVIQDAKFDGNHATWTARCEGTTIHADMNFHGDSLEAVLKMNMANAGPMTVRMTSRRIGDCK
ncbi:MAG: DUF3617 domain-containing protein [Acidobacteriota bacterium]|nr:DUF3617 domain-containing protein [Acidobacteriota bacterium]